MKKLLFAVCLALTSCGSENRVDTITGVPGARGPAGVNGHNTLMSVLNYAPGCSSGGVTLIAGLDVNDSGTLEPTEISGSAEVCNGAVGQSATPSAFTPVGLVDPCGTAPGIHNEIFIKLYNGTLISSFSDSSSGNNTRFAVLTAGTYQTTDGDNCVFTLNSSGAITYENHHY